MSGSADVQRYVEVGIEAEIEAGLLAGVKIWVGYASNNVYHCLSCHSHSLANVSEHTVLLLNRAIQHVSLIVNTVFYHHKLDVYAIVLCTTAVTVLQILRLSNKIFVLKSVILGWGLGSGYSNIIVFSCF